MSNSRAFETKLPHSADEQISQLSPAKQALLKLRLQREGLDAPGQKLTIPKRTSQDLPPLSFAQQRLWVLNQLEPDTASYNMHKSVRLIGPLDVGALEQAMSEIVRRHEALRTTFSDVDGQPVQVISPAQPLNVAVVDLSDLPEPERETQALALATREAQQPFDLARGPLLRTTLLRLGRQDQVLMLTVHHIISDGWSMGVLYSEIGVLYEAFSTGRPSPLPDLPVQYADFALWQRRWLQVEVLKPQIAYWRQQLDGAPPLLEMPTDRPRPSIQSFRGESRPFVLSKALTKGLKILSLREGVTLFMTLLAAFKTLLYRYSGQEDILVGSPIAGRSEVETERLIGFFVNTLVLRSDLSGNPTFRELLGRVREVALGAYAHQDVPFETLVKELQPERDLSRTPLFQVMFALQNVPTRTLRLPGLTLSPLKVDSGTAKFDLNLSLAEDPEGLRGSIEYCADLFKAETIERMAAHLRTLLQGVVANPEQRLSQLPLLTEEERHQLLVEWNSTEAGYPEDQCLHQLFEAQAEQTPKATAVVFEHERLSYRELNERANRLAHHLQALGVGPEVPVGLYLERSPEMVVGLLAILKAGGAYLPLDPTYPNERLAFMLKDSQAAVLLTQERLVEGLPESAAQVLCLDANWEVMARQSRENPVSEATPENLAYVLYTSGSTGRPKGVQIPHQAVVNFLNSMRQRPGLSNRDTLLAVTTLSFDIAALEIFLPITVGARLVLVSREVASDGAQLLERLTHSGTTVLQATPATWRLLLEAGWQGSRQLQILCGGEALSRELANQLLAGSRSLWNLYGPTETTIWSAACEVKLGEGPVPIGRPIVNTQIYLLDSQLQPVPVGVPGQLHIGGVGLARGYLNRPELTAERFIPDPFSAEPGARLYKTGDLARYLPDGNIEFLGRIDQQVKVRGFRIELGEIEAVLSQHPAVQEGVIIAREDVPGDKVLVAYVVSDRKPAPTMDELRSFLQGKLPAYMVPAAFVLLGALPLTPNGKVDRLALPAPDQIGSGLARAFVAPRNALEAQLSMIWEQVLSLKTISVRDNFFELGGHSLLALRLLTRIEKVFNNSLPLAALFQAPTIEQLAQVLRQRGWRAPWTSLVAMQPGGSRRPFFCVPGNLTNVFHELRHLAQHLGPDQPFYGLQDGVGNPTEIKALAAHYVTEVRSVQPLGPYFLSGVCAGGLIAFEMARQLRAQGESVGLLALIEPNSPPAPGLHSYFKFAAGMLSRGVKRLGHHSSRVSRLDSAHQRTYLRLRKKVVANLWAKLHYVPQTYPGRITLFLASESLTNSAREPRLSWRQYAGDGFDLQVIPGHPDTITGNNGAKRDQAQFQILAKKLRACLEDVQATLVLGLTSLLFQWFSVVPWEFLNFT